MARPQKLAAERRSNRTVRYTEAEWQLLSQRGAEAGLAASEFVREASLRGRVVKVVRKGAADPALISELNALAMQLASLGNLANQVALYLHTDRSIPREWAALPRAIEETRQEASRLLVQIVEKQSPARTKAAGETP